MPLYQYRCESCGVSFERNQSFSDEPLKRCPECDGGVHRVIQPVGIIFKGSGFYVTDNRRNSTLLPGKREDSSDSDKAKSDSPASEAKPAPSPSKTSSD